MKHIFFPIHTYSTLLNLILIRLIDFMLISPIERRYNQKPILDVFDNKFSSFHCHEVLIVFTKVRCHRSHLQTVFPDVHFNIILPSNLYLPRSS